MLISLKWVHKASRCFFSKREQLRQGFLRCILALSLLPSHGPLNPFRLSLDLPPRSCEHQWWWMLSSCFYI